MKRTWFILPSLAIAFAITAALVAFTILYVAFSHPATTFFATALFDSIFVSYSGSVLSAGINNGWILVGLFAAIFAVVLVAANTLQSRHR
ncbi:MULTISPECIES: hypothetical protein [Corynebacterium]|uniref:hypothetical protein n=1 Tax=Corynebacterium TaxID=1716 RepID=UPI0008A1552F|nr:MULTISPECIES: hypothetical protein [Corynebacterium]MCT1443422.1 hypothetical protein [Corynebacterium glucuronolyticum]OFO48691.1 hypothetical protein HMPREF3044_08310 [Corynebacterium sp. HMSC073D01]QQU88445.1 hypothetical protein I6I68_00055 [Corynebacterium glucuronolyticum]